MSSDLFAALGIDIAAIVNDELGPLLVDAVLVRRDKSSRGGDITAGNGITSTSHPCRGMRAGTSGAIGGTLIRSNFPSISILGASLPDGIKPEKGDLVIIEGGSYQVDAVVTDEAQALHAITTDSE